MIVAERKPLDEIIRSIGASNRVLLVGCGECVTVCQAGGEKEVGILAELLTIHARKTEQPLEVIERTVKRQCDPEFVDPLREEVNSADIVVSLACGCGVQLMAERFPEARVVPALNTLFMGVTVAEAEWEERCQACGDCQLERFAGICPITRCAKSLLNGPCGGSQDGRCEIDPEVPCAWQLIIDRLTARNELERLLDFVPPLDWSRSRDGGLRRLVRPDARL